MKQVVLSSATRIGMSVAMMVCMIVTVLSPTGPVGTTNVAAAVGGYKLPWPGETWGTLGGINQYYLPPPDHSRQIDFTVPGDIVAAKSGTVRFRKDSSNQCSPPSTSCDWRYANILIIEHSSQEYSWYVHLKYDSIPNDIQRGTQVNQGRKIGEQGATGAASGAHLHFMVSSSLPSLTDESQAGQAPWPSISSLLEVDFQEISWSGLVAKGRGSLKSENGSTVPPCDPSPDHVILYADERYGGSCVRLGVGQYPNPGHLGAVGNDNAESIKVGSRVKAILYKDDNYARGDTTYEGDDERLANRAWANTVSSVKVENKSPNGEDGVKLCDHENFGGECRLYTAGEYADLGDWKDRTESIQYVGNYVGCYFTRLHTEVNFSGNPIGYQESRATIDASGRNHVRSLNIYQDRCRPPGKPHNPNPPTGSQLDYRTSLDVSFDGEGDQWQIHVWGNNYDRWRDWEGSRSLRLDGLAPGTYQWQAIAKNGYGNSGWTEPPWTLEIRPQPSSAPRQEGPVNITSPLWVGNTAYFTITIKNYSSTTATPALHPYIEGQDPNGSLWRADGSQPGSAVIPPTESQSFQVQQVVSVPGTWTAGGIYLWNNDAGTYWMPLPANGHNQQFSFSVQPPPCTTIPAGQYCAEYFNNTTLTSPAVRTGNEQTPINYSWGADGPGNGVRTDDFSARWRGRFPFEAGRYRFYGTTDDGVRVWVGGQLIVDEWRTPQVLQYSNETDLSAGEHEVKVEYFEHVGAAQLQVRWEKVDGPPTIGLRSSSGQRVQPQRRLHIELRQRGSGNLLYEHVPAPGVVEIADFTFPGVTPGDYDLLIKPQMGLRASQPITLKQGLNIVTYDEPQAAGDVLEDNVVDIFDYSLVVSNFAATRPTAQVCRGEIDYGLSTLPGYANFPDTNCNGSVDIFDYSAIVSNFGKAGVGDKGANVCVIDDPCAASIAGAQSQVRTAAQRAGGLSVIPATASAVVGTTLPAAVRYDTAGHAVNGLTAIVTFDPKIVQLDSVVFSQAFADRGADQSDVARGTLRLTGRAPTGQPVIGAGVLATLTFKALVVGTSPVQITYTRGRTGTSAMPLNGKAVQVIGSVAGATLTVTAPTQPPTITPTLTPSPTPTSTPPTSTPPTTEPSPTPTTPVQPTPTPTPTSRPDPGVVDPALPGPVALRLGKVTTSSIQLLWNDVARTETRYVVAFRQRDGNSWTYVGLKRDARSWTHARLARGVSFIYAVRACGPTGCSPWSAEVGGSTPPPPPLIAPSNLRLGKVTSASIQVRWNDNTLAETSYVLAYRVYDSQTWVSVTLKKNATTWTHQRLQPGTRYTYMVKACDASKCTGWTPEVTGSTPPPPPLLSPSNLRVGKVTATTIQLLWNDNTLAETRYVLAYRFINSQSWTFVTLKKNAKSWTHTRVPLRDQFVYKIQACDASKCTAWTPEVNSPQR